MAMKAIEDSGCYLCSQMVLDKSTDKEIGTYFQKENILKTEPIFNALLSEGTDGVVYAANLATQEVIEKVLKEKGFEIKKGHLEEGILFSLCLAATDPKDIPTVIKTYRKLNGTEYATKLQKHIVNRLKEEKNSITEVETMNLQCTLSDMILSEKGPKEEKK